MTFTSATRTRVLVIFAAIALATLSLKTHRAFTMGGGSAAGRPTTALTTSDEARRRDQAAAARASALSAFLLDPHRQGWALLGQPLKASFGLAPLAPIAPNISAVKSATLTGGTDVNGNGFINPGDTIVYSVVVSNTGSNASNVVFTDTLNANLTLVGAAIASPIAVTDSYTCIGNVGLTVPMVSGLLANDVNPQGTGTLAASAGATSANGGNVAVSADGSFTYKPAAGFEGTDSFTYTLTHSNGLTDTATVTLTVSGMIWFVDNNAGVNGDGRLGTPFNSLANFVSGAADDPGDTIFLYRQTATNYVGPLTLLANQKLGGQGMTVPLAGPGSFTGLTIPTFSNTLPATSGANPVIAHTANNLTLGSGNALRGFNLSNSGGATGHTALSGTSFGALTVSEVSVSNSNGVAINLHTGSPTASFTSVSASGGTRGLILQNTTGSFTVTGSGGTCTDADTSGCSGGTIASTTGGDDSTTAPVGTGIVLNNVQSVSFTRMWIHDHTNYGLRGNSVNGLTLNNSVVNGTNGTNGATPFQEASIYLTELTGSGGMASDVVSGGRQDNVHLENTGGTLSSFTVANCTIKNNSTSNDGNIGFHVMARTSANMTVTLQNSLLQGNRTDTVNTDAADSSTLNITISGNTIVAGTGGNNQGNLGIDVTASASAQVTFVVDNNAIGTDDNFATKKPLLNTGINIFDGTAASSNMSGTVTNNKVQNDDVTFGPAQSNGFGIRVFNSNLASMQVNVTGNKVRGVQGDYGILAESSGTVSAPAAGRGAAAFAVTNNDVIVGSQALDDIRLQARNFNSICGRVTGNDTATGGAGFVGIFVRQANSAVFNLESGTGNLASNNPLAGSTSFTGTITSVATNFCSSIPLALLDNQSGKGRLLAQRNMAAPEAANRHLTAKATSVEVSGTTLPRETASSAGGGQSPGGLQTSAARAIRGGLAAFSSPQSYVGPQLASAKASGHAVTSGAMSGETVTINGGGGGFTLPLGKSTTIVFRATISASYTGTSIANQATVMAAGPITVLSNNLSTTVYQPPTISQAFASQFVSPGTSVNLTFTVNNPNVATLNGLAVSNQLPTGWSVADSTSSHCGGTVTTTAATRTIALSGGSLAASGSCQFTVAVTASTTEGLVTNTTSTITANESDAGTAASADITVIKAPTLTQSFTPNLIVTSQTSTLQFNLSNPNTTLALNGLHYTDTLPSGTTAADVGATTVCSDGTYSITSNAITFDKPSLAASGTCQLSVTVTGATAGVKNNTTSTVTTTNSNAGTAASATLTVNNLTLGNYSNASVPTGGNTTITPSAAPVGATSVVATTATSFKGTLTANPTTGVVTVTNANPAGSYTITVKANGVITKTFTLTVNNTSICSSANFATKTDFNVGNSPQYVTVGDFNGDGKQDLAVVNFASNNVTIFLGDGSGSFSAAAGSPVSVGTGPYYASVGDFNGDGKQDLAVSNFNSNNVTILLGDGSGGFAQAPGSPVSAGSQADTVTVGDFNGDGKQDLAVANYGSNNVTILLGNGSGGFAQAPGSPITVGTNALDLVVGDFNADGKQDLAVSNFNSNNVTILLGNGSGGFSEAPGSPIAVADGPGFIVLGDFNNDGKQDLAMGNFRSPDATILLGDGSGGFTQAPGSPVSLGFTTYSVAVGDFNGDGKQDLAAADYTSNKVAILLGDGSGGFSAASNSPVTVGSIPVNVAVGDFNGDGRQDLVTSNSQDNTVSVLLSNCTANSAPTISDITDQSTNEDTPTSALNFTVGDVETAAGSLTVTGSSSNTTLVPNANIVFGGAGANRTVTIAPAANQSGTTTITISVSDGSLTTSDTFILTVNAVNDPPVLTVPGAQSATALSNHTISGISVADVDAGSGSLQVTLSAARGTLSLSQTTGLGFTTGNGSQNSSMVFTGTLANINAALTNLVYRGVDASTGGDTISLAVNDQGNTGLGGAQSDSKTIAVTLTKATQTINFSSLSDKTYGNANFGVSATATSGLSVSLSILSGPATINSGTVTITGTGTVVVRAAQAGDNSYSAATNVDQSFTVNKATLNVTADNQTKVYGAANPTLTTTFTGFVNGQTLATSDVTGSPTLSTAATTSSGVSSYAITAGAGTLASSNYNFNLVNGTLSVTPATLTVMADNQAKVYGEANPTLTASFSGFVNSETASVLSGAPALTTAATASSNAGSYPITISAGSLAATNYTFTFANGTLSVAKAVLTVTADKKTKLYGAVNPTLTVSYSGFVNNETATVLTGTLSLTTTATQDSPVGDYDISTAVGTLAAANYDLSLVDNTLTVTTTALTVTATDKSKTYGEANPALTFTYSGFVNGENASIVTGAPTLSTTATASSNVGGYPITAAPGNLNAPNYALVFVDGTLTINQAALTATAGNTSRGYGAINPSFTGNITGLQNGDNITGLYTTAATPGSPVNSYAITPALVDPDGKLGNYTVTLNNGTLVVTPAALIVTADHKTKVYGAANPALTASYTGLVNNETASALGGTLSLTTTATPSSAAGHYPITVSGLTSPNYAITFVNGELSVSQAALTVTADNQSKVYGDANPTLTATFTGFVNGETLAASDVTGTFALSTSATASSGVNSYPITPSVGTLASSNYSFTFVNGALSITPATLTVTANNAARIYGANNPAFTASYSGFVGNDTASVLSGEPSLTTTAIPISGSGAYPITAAAGNVHAANYTFTFASGTLTVNKATLTMTADNKTKSYGAANPDLTVSYTGFANGETVSALSGAPSLNTTATPNSAVGSYPITLNAGTLSAANYDLTFVDGTLTVNKAATSTVLASSLAPASYGQPITLTATVSSSTTGTPAGDVQFFDGANLLGKVTLNNGSVSFPIAALGVANHSLTAVYGGDDKFAVSTSTALLQTVSPATSALTLSSSVNPAVWKQYLTFTTLVSGVNGALAPTGAVTFKDGATVLATVTINSMGRAAFSTSALSTGAHPITAEYSGNSNYLAATASALELSVSKGLTATTLVSSANPSSLSQPVTLTAKVLGTGGTPTGRVEFFAGETSLGTAPLIGQSAALTTLTLSDTTNTLTAVYTGDDQFAASTSPALTQTVVLYCTFKLSPLNQTFELVGGTGQIQITTRGDCDWTAITNAAWITLTGSGVRSGDGTVSFTVAPLTNGLARTGTMTIAGQTVTITQAKPIAVVSAASYAGLEVAPGAIVSLFGANLSTATDTANSLPLPTTLAGTMVKVTDSQGVSRLSPLFYVSPSQINYLMPTETALGPATITVVNDTEEVTGAGLIQIVPVSPGLFTANSSGQDVAAAVLFRLSGDGAQSYEAISQFDAQQNKYVPLPLDLGPDTDQVFLLLFGTGLRNRTSLVGVTALIGNIEVEVLYAGPQGGFEGLDQVNLSIPRSLIGVGETNLMLTVDGKVVNTVRIKIR